LAAQFANTLQQLHSFPVMVRHFMPPLFGDTNPQYGVNPIGV
jgi:hypothetical protein